MATLAALLNDVYALTNRPDLTGESTFAVKAATLKAHRSDFFPRDIKEQGIQFLFAAYIQQLDYLTLFPTWRALSYFRKYDTAVLPQPDEISKELEIITPDNIFDEYKIMRTNVAYLAGSNLQIRSSTSMLYGIVGYYANPDLTYVVPSWISDDQPYVIIFEAVRMVFKTIGYDEQAAYYNNLVEEQYQQLRRTAIQAKGY